jgi:hypothetical protein
VLEHRNFEISPTVVQKLGLVMATIGAIAVLVSAS